MVVSNPPYIGADESLPREVIEWEPRSALIAGPSGFEAIERILGEAPGWLRPGGAVVVEIAPDQAGAATAAAEAAGFDAVVRREGSGGP